MIVRKVQRNAETKAAPWSPGPSEEEISRRAALVIQRLLAGNGAAKLAELVASQVRLQVDRAKVRRVVGTQLQQLQAGLPRPTPGTDFR